MTPEHETATEDSTADAVVALEERAAEESAPEESAAEEQAPEVTEEERDAVPVDTQPLERAGQAIDDAREAASKAARTDSIDAGDEG